MGWVIRVEHTSGYRYVREVRASYNEARMTTLTTAGQTTLESRLTVEPRCRPHRYVDYWATVVDAFDIQVPHSSLQVNAMSVVETEAAEPFSASATWDDLASARVLDAMAEFLAPTPYVPADPEVAALAAGLRAGCSVGDAVDAVVAWVAEHVEYRKGATRVNTSAAEVFTNRAGVCQDYAHVTLALLRAMGVPARYVSGYLHPSAGARPGDAVVGESHAWVDVWVGRWIGIDPTHSSPVGERHVVVAYGRDYADVPPLKGVYLGGPSEDLDVSVVITRLA